MTEIRDYDHMARHRRNGKAPQNRQVHLKQDNGKVPAQKLGRAWSFDVEDLDSWLKSGKQASDSSRKA